MIGKITLYLILLVSTLNMYGGDIETTKCSEYIDIFKNSDILIKILSNANNLNDLNELLSRFVYTFPEAFKMLKENTKGPNADAMQVINQYLKNRLKKDYNWNKREKYYTALKTLSTESKHTNILKLLSSACIDLPIKKQYNLSNFPRIEIITIPTFCEGQRLTLRRQNLIPLESLKEDLNLVIRIGADINTKDSNRLTIISRAVSMKQPELITFLINAGADINDSDNNRCTPLMVAINDNNKDISELLIKAGADVNLKDLDGDTALEKAIAGNKLELVKLLLYAGANLRIKNKQGYTPLATAVTLNNLKLVELLLAFNADVNAKDINGWTPLQIAFNDEMINLIKNANKSCAFL